MTVRGTVAGIIRHYDPPDSSIGRLCIERGGTPFVEDIGFALLVAGTVIRIYDSKAVCLIKGPGTLVALEGKQVQSFGATLLGLG
jgi:hypothetical protein